MAIRLDDRVAVITGAGGGLGRSYALLFAALGARVVVNDLGCSPDGTGSSPEAADGVVREIRAANGTAVASYDGVETAQGGESIIRKALETFGRVDILVNNAGNFRFGTIDTMNVADWQAILDVHLTGAFNVSKVAVPIMRSHGYGRIVLTTSGTGLWGPVGVSPADTDRGERAFPPVPGRGAANYAAAKAGLIGFMNALKEELRPKDIQVNCIAPWSTSRVSVLPDDFRRRLRGELVARWSPTCVRTFAKRRVAFTLRVEDTSGAWHW